MKKIAFILPLFFFLIWSVVPVGAEDVVVVEEMQLTLLAFGDSITQGLARKYDGDGNRIRWGILEPPMGRATKDWGYPIELDKILEENLQVELELELPVTATVYNWGHEGWTSNNALECDERPKNCIDTVIASRPAEFIMILFGSNDLYQAVSSETTRFNMEQMIDKSIAAGIEPVIGTITPNTDHHAFFAASTIDTVYNPQLRELAVEKNVLLADHYEEMLADWENEWTSGDGLHLGRAGNIQMAENWYQAIKGSVRFIKKPGPIVIEPVFQLLLRH